MKKNKDRSQCDKNKNEEIIEEIINDNSEINDNVEISDKSDEIKNLNDKLARMQADFVNYKNRSDAASRSAGTRARTSACTTSTRRRSTATSTARRPPSPSAWSIRTSGSMWTSPCAATANTPTRSPTRCCSTRTSAVTSRNPTCAAVSTAS